MRQLIHRKMLWAYKRPFSPLCTNIKKPINRRFIKSEKLSNRLLYSHMCLQMWVFFFFFLKTEIYSLSVLYQHRHKIPISTLHNIVSISMIWHSAKYRFSSFILSTVLKCHVFAFVLRIRKWLWRSTRSSDKDMWIDVLREWFWFGSSDSIVRDMNLSTGLQDLHSLVSTLLND